MKIYLAGPMTGYPNHNWPAFFRAAAELRVRGYHVINPAERESYVVCRARSWDENLRADIKLLVECDAICLLPDWEKSRGAKLERAVARGLAFPTFLLHELLDVREPT